jgi:hypothetical protein
VGTTERVTVEEIWTLRDEVTGPMAKIKKDSAATVGELDRIKNATSGLNKAFQFAGNFGLASFGLQAVQGAIDTVIKISDKLFEAAQAAEEMRDKTSAVIWLLKSQDLITGPTSFRDAMQAANYQVGEFRKMASEGIGGSGQYAEAWQKLARPILKVGGSLDDVREFTQALVPMSKMYGDVAFEAVTKVLSGYKKLPPTMLTILDLSKEQLAQFKHGVDAFEGLKHSIATMQPIAEAEADSLAARMQKAHDASAKAWREAGEVWAPILSGASLAIAKGISGMMPDFLRNVPTEHSSAIDKMHYLAGVLGPMLGASRDKIDAIFDSLGSPMKSTGKQVGEFGAEIEDAAGGVGEMADAVRASTKLLKDMNVYFKGVNESRIGRTREGNGWDLGGPAWGGQMTVQEQILAAAAMAKEIGIAPELQTPEVVGMLGDLAKGAYDAGMGLRSLKDLIDDPQTQEFVPNLLKAMMAGAVADPIKALRDYYGKKDGALSKPPQVHVAKVEIKIDARHQDPDRLAAAVYDRFGRQAARGRTSARTAPPFS